MPALGLGTWELGEDVSRRRDEVTSVQLAFDLGVRLFDTAEMYGEGGSEEVLGEALAGRRDEVFLVSKVYPHNASRRGTAAACERSLARLRTDRIDLFLLHWRGSHPLVETIEAFERLRDAGKIRHWGVSNLDVRDMRALWQTPGGDRCAANQVYYSASTRGVEFDLLPWQQARGVPTMAYCPLDRGELAEHPVLAQVGARHGRTASQVAIAWLMSRPQVMVIPKAVRAAHLRENVSAGSLVLTEDDLADIDRALPAPTRHTPLAVV